MHYLPVTEQKNIGRFRFSGLWDSVFGVFGSQRIHGTCSFNLQNLRSLEHWRRKRNYPLKVRGKIHLTKKHLIQRDRNLYLFLWGKL